MGRLISRPTAQAVTTVIVVKDSKYLCCTWMTENLHCHSKLLYRPLPMFCDISNWFIVFFSSGFEILVSEISAATPTQLVVFKAL